MLMPVLAALMQGGDWRQAFILLAVGCFLLAPLAVVTLRHAQANKYPAVGPSVATETAGGRKMVLLARSPAFHAIFWSYTICGRSEEHTSELQSLMRISYAVFCLKKKKINYTTIRTSEKVT